MMMVLLGITLILLGGMAADSPYPGWLYAGGVVAMGCVMAFVGQARERRRGDA